MAGGLVSSEPGLACPRDEPRPDPRERLIVAPTAARYVKGDGLRIIHVGFRIEAVE